MSADAVSLTEHHHLTEMHENLRRKLQESSRAEGRLNSLRGDILSMVVSENYDNAKRELTAYVENKTSYPAFQERANRYVSHCCDLIMAIKTKRNFPGLAALSLAKQQEIHEKVLEHFEELKTNLKQVEKVERESKLTDMRSTVWVVKTFVMTVTAVTIAALLIDIQNGMFSSFVHVTDHYIDQASTFVVNLIRF